MGLMGCLNRWVVIRFSPVFKVSSAMKKALLWSFVLAIVLSVPLTVAASNLGTVCSQETVTVPMAYGPPLVNPRHICSASKDSAQYKIALSSVIPGTIIPTGRGYECVYDVANSNWLCLKAPGGGGEKRVDHPPPSTAAGWCSQLFRSVSWASCP